MMEYDYLSLQALPFAESAEYSREVFYKNIFTFNNNRNSNLIDYYTNQTPVAK